MNDLLEFLLQKNNRQDVPLDPEGLFLKLIHKCIITLSDVDVSEYNSDLKS